MTLIALLGTPRLSARKRLKTSMLSAADIKSNPFAVVILGPLARTGQPLGGDLAGSTCRFRSRCMPTASTWLSSRSSAPALRHCI